MQPQFVEKYLSKKLNENNNIIVFTFYELRIKTNLTEEEIDEFLRLAKIRLENIGYLVYFTGAKYTYKGERKNVEDNQLMVAIKG